ncbi:hypothetical protein KEM56_004078 [Ascosphaera pollenicola]|nr:hypothetical protein KEM56_004078 [Ascosphaera pollenicola]
MIGPQTRPDSPVQGETGFSTILDHVLCNEGQYEIPLRSMFELNLEAGRNMAYAVSGFASPKHQNFSKPIKQEDPAAVMRSRLLRQITRRPSEQCKLPPSFLTSFVRRCFVPDLEYVDFPQALTALDYIKDLESRRVSEVAIVQEKLEHLDGSHHGLDTGKLAGVLRLRDSIEERSRTAAALYSQAYLRARQWTIVNEMMLTPFNKNNCLAMLNTLFPSKLNAPPTRHVSVQRMADQRRKFADYIHAVEENKSTDCLRKIIVQDARAGETTGWPLTHEYIEKYLMLANDLIAACYQLSNYGNLEGPRTTRRGKQDSGISVSSDERPASSGTNATSSGGSTASSKKYLRPHASTVFGDGRPTLEKIGKELRKMKSRGNLNDPEKKPRHTKSLGALRKIKSLGRLRGGDRSAEEVRQCCYVDSPNEVEEFRRKRVVYESKRIDIAMNLPGAATAK